MSLSNERLEVLHWFTAPDAYINLETGYGWRWDGDGWVSGVRYGLRNLWGMEVGGLISRQDDKLFITTLGIGAYNKADKRFVSTHPNLSFSQMRSHRLINMNVDIESSENELRAREELIGNCVSAALMIESLLDNPDIHVNIYHKFLDEHGDLLIKALNELAQKGAKIVEDQKGRGQRNGEGAVEATPTS